MTAIRDIVEAKGLGILTARATRLLLKKLDLRGRHLIAKLIASLCLPKAKVMLPHRNGHVMVFDPQNPHEVPMFFDLFCEDLSSVLSRILGHHDIFVDCGASIGYFTFVAASLTASMGG